MSGTGKRPLPKVVKRRKIKWLRYASQAISFIILVLLVPIGILAVPAGICSIPIGDLLRIDCIFGVLQRVFANPLNLALYVLLTFAVIPVIGSLVFGRLFCGFMCPIGTILDLLGRVKRVNFLKKVRLDSRYNKYAVAAGFLGGASLAGFPAFCTICPIRGVCTAYGSVRATELVLTAVPVVLEFSDKRAWCKYFCPVGAMLGLLGFRKLLGFKVDTSKCIKCKACMRVCPTNAITEKSLETGEISRTECIACGRCYDVCMYDALKFGVLPLRVANR